MKLRHAYTPVDSHSCPGTDVFTASTCCPSRLTLLTPPESHLRLGLTALMLADHPGLTIMTALKTVLRLLKSVYPIGL